MKFKPVRFILLFVILTSCSSINNFSNNGQKTGAWGPIILDAGEVSGTYIVFQEQYPETKIEVNVIKSKNQLFLYPITPLMTGSLYQLYKEGNPEPIVKEINVRESCVAYISNLGGESEIWKKCPGQDPVQLTKTDGHVGDMTVSRSGEWIYFLVNSAADENEIWQVRSDGNGQIMIYKCSGSKCSDLDFCPLIGKLAFVHPNNKKQIKILDLVSEKVIEIEGSGTELKFSPNGEYLSYFDDLSSQLIIINLSNQKRITKLSSSGLVGEWARNSQSILFGELEYWGGIPGVKAYELNVESGEVKDILYDPNQELEFYQPKYSKEEGVYLTSIRQRSAGPSKQLWLIRKGAKVVKQITSDPLYHYSFPSWNSDFSELLFQRYPMNTTDGYPQVVIWNQSTDTFQVIAENAFKPFWLS